MLVLNYQYKDQFGLELEYIYEGWVVKFEGIGVCSLWENYYVMVVGVEYGFYGLFGSNIDMILIIEYMYDLCDDVMSGFLEYDVGIGGRFNFNDEFGMAMFGGILWDLDSEEKVILFEYE